jgi:hypothetical protein
MPYKRYTSCFSYPEGGKPYNENDRLAWAAEQLLLALFATGTFALAGLIGGPIGVLIGAIFGSVIGFTALLQNAADSWLNRRLICLSKDHPKCAVGIVSYNPSRSDLGVFDNDQYFDVVLMPHPTELVDSDDPDIRKSNPKWLMPANRYNADGTVVAGFSEHVRNHPANDILNDSFQAWEFLAAQDYLKPLGYEPPNKHERVALHCEAEGDFWVRIKKLAPALALLIDAALVVTAAGAAAGSWAGSAAGCALGAWFFGPIGCAIGGLLGGLLGGAAGAAAGAAAASFGAIIPILNAIFEAGPGDVEDANVGDKTLGPIRMYDRVAVVGEHVYDGYHTGWHEFHPLMRVVKIAPPDPGWTPLAAQGGAGGGAVGFQYYLTWQPDFSPYATPPPPPPGETIALTDEDMRQGLNSENFKKRCRNLKETWCSMLQQPFNEETRRSQQELHQRWTIHPMVDGCRPRNSAPPPLH